MKEKTFQNKNLKTNEEKGKSKGRKGTKGRKSEIRIEADEEENKKHSTKKKPRNTKPKGMFYS